MFPVRSVAMDTILRRADMYNSRFVSPTELTNLMNDNLEIAYHHLVAALGDMTFCADCIIPGIGGTGTIGGIPVTWPTQAGASTTQSSRWALPADFGRLIRCEWTPGGITAVSTLSGHGQVWQLDNGAPNIRWVPMHPFDIAGSVYDSTPRNWSETEVAYWITSYPGPTLPKELNDQDVTTRYWIAFLPVPSSQVAVHILYIPQPPTWGTDDTGVIRLDDLAWKFVREATAADLLEKQRSDASPYRNNAAQYLADIDNMALRPDNANPPATVDIYGGSSVPPYGRRRQVWG